MIPGHGTLGFVGIGLIGEPIVHRVLRAGHSISVWNRSPEKLQRIVAAGAVRCSSLANVAGSAETIYLCLSDAEAVRSVIWGKDGLSSRVSDQTVIVDHSSISPDQTRAFATQLFEDTGARWIDAPVSGGVPAAEAGELIIFAGGDLECFARVLPILNCYARQVTLMGGIGTGQTVKLCNQIMAGSAMLTAAEAMYLAHQAGIDPRKLPSALAGAMGDSLPFQIMAPRMMQDEVTPIGHVSSMLKDLRTAVDLAEKLGSPLPITRFVANLYTEMSIGGFADHEPSHYFKLLISNALKGGSAPKEIP